MNDTNRRDMDQRGMDRDRNVNMERDPNMPMVRDNRINYPDSYRDDYRDIYRGYRRDRMNKSTGNVFRMENNYRKYNGADEIFESIVDHLTKGVKFHDKMMDLYGFLGLYGFKKMHEYQYLCESMERRQVKCYVIDHMNFLIKDSCDEKGLDFIPDSWYQYSRNDVTPDARKQYVGPSFEAYKQWEEETKELLSYCANELMYLGDMAAFNEVMEMVEDVEEEIQSLDKVLFKLKSVDYNMEYVVNMQEELCEKYDKKIEELFTEKLEEDKIKKKHKVKYSMEEKYQRRSSRTGRYMR